MAQVFRRHPGRIADADERAPEARRLLQVGNELEPRLRRGGRGDRARLGVDASLVDDHPRERNASALRRTSSPAKCERLHCAEIPHRDPESVAGESVSAATPGALADDGDGEARLELEIGVSGVGRFELLVAE